MSMVAANQESRRNIGERIKYFQEYNFSRYNIYIGDCVVTLIAIVDIVTRKKSRM